MYSSMFDALMNALQKNDSTDNKMHRMKVAIGSAGMISTSQVAQLLKFLPSDSDKLELAKTAHGYLSDRGSSSSMINLHSYGNALDQRSYGSTLNQHSYGNVPNQYPYGNVFNQYSYGNVLKQDPFGATIGEAFSSDITKARLNEYLHRRY